MMKDHPCRICGKRPAYSKGLCNSCFTTQHRFGFNREAALERDKHTCQICGRTEPDVKLIVHHIDGNGYYEPEPNNGLDNLITLCSTRCHGLVHKYKGRLLRDLQPGEGITLRSPGGPDLVSVFDLMRFMCGAISGTCQKLWRHVKKDCPDLAGAEVILPVAGGKSPFIPLSMVLDLIKQLPCAILNDHEHLLLAR